eukprot:Lithocolla_globosa_v1_NODE_3044_length_1783_cov_5.271412.p1 type:complete len:375 gc:universal NODE_3044_length_1783_cov_5.271412:1142-18(-)
MVALFAEKAIVGSVLFSLDHDDLKEMAIASVGKRIKVLTAIEALNEHTQEEEKKAMIGSVRSKDTQGMEDGLLALLEMQNMPTFEDELNIPQELYMPNADMDAAPILQAKYGYTGIKATELTITKGENLLLLEKQTEEWWYGRSVKSGQFGYFPAAYVFEVTKPAVLKKLRKQATLLAEDAPSTIVKVKEKNIANSLEQSRKGGLGKGRLNVITPGKTINKESLSVQYEGTLCKQGGKIKTWKRRWFVLTTDCILYYFKSSSDNTPLGMIVLLSYQVAFLRPDESGKKHSFKIFHTGGQARTYFFYADTEKDMQNWVNEIKKATSQDDLETPASPSSSLSASNAPHVAPTTRERQNSIRRPAPALPAFEKPPST